MEDYRSEDTLIFYGLTPGKTKIGVVQKALKQFFTKKKTLDPSDRFNIIFFKENAPHYLEDFTLHPEHILNALNTFKKKMVKPNIGGGIFVAITFIIDVFKRIGEKCFRLIVLTDEGSSKIAEGQLPVIENLVEKVVDMPFFIDVIQISKSEANEDLELIRLAHMCKGDAALIFNSSYLSNELDLLANKKDLNPDRGLDEEELKPEIIPIPINHQPFYENLAEDPYYITNEETCSVCFKKSRVDLVKCPKCNTIVHKNCWSHWAKSSHIGMINVFRCHQCYNLLRLDKGYVKMIQTGEKPSVEDIEVQVLDLQSYLEEIEPEDGPKIVEVEDQFLGFKLPE